MTVDGAEKNFVRYCGMCAVGRSVLQSCQLCLNVIHPSSPPRTVHSPVAVVPFDALLLTGGWPFV